MVKTDGNRLSYCAIIVDDCFFAINRDEDWINEAITMLLQGGFRKAYCRPWGDDHHLRNDSAYGS